MGKATLTTAECIHRAKSAHGNSYDYSRVRYYSQYDKITIICPKHGEFYQTPKNHWNGQTCPTCARRLRPQCSPKSTEQFIQDAQALHGNRYDYSKTKYVSGHEKVIITCRIHGDFSQDACNHLSDHGCPQCGIEDVREGLKSSTEDFIQKARQLQGNRWDYSKVMYKSSDEKVEFGCSIHGPFYATPNAHLRGDGCPRCGIVRRSEAAKLSMEEFLGRVSAINGDHYNYSKFVYVNGKTKGIIICPEHGEFLQTPENHIHFQQGCPKCFGKGLIGLEEFIRRSKEVHGDTYDYSQTCYANSKTPTTIICRDHGPFFTTPDIHMSGHGCPKCGVMRSKFYAQQPDNILYNRMKSQMMWVERKRDEL